jgi:hypothetical protein
VEVERIACFLVPEQRIVAQHLRVRDGGFEVEATVRVDREPGRAADFGERRLDAPPVLVAMYALRIAEAIGFVTSRTSTMRTGMASLPMDSAPRISGAGCLRFACRGNRTLDPAASADA